MVEPINLNRARKARARAAAEAQAALNREKFGRTKAAKLNEHAAAQRMARTLDQSRRDTNPSTSRLRPARAEELGALSDLCLRSKAVWGYDAAFMDACRASLTLTADDLAGGLVQVAEESGGLVGLAQVILGADVAVLEKLFVEPARLRTGVGRMLFGWARDLARRSGARTLTIDADPGAADFYRRMGAIDAGAVPSDAVSGRSMPRLTLDLAIGR